MGLFSINYNKPGPGVRKDEPKKKAVPRFFELLFRKITELVKLNLLFMIPFIVVFALVFGLATFTNDLVASLPFILLFPFTAGLAFVTRNYVREEHAFVLSDFVDAVKQNWKTFLVNGIISVVLYLIMYIAVQYYSSQVSQGFLYYIPLAVCIIAIIMFLFAQYYIPVMIVTFDMKYLQILKNGVIFAIIGLWRNLLLTVIIGLEIFILIFLTLYMPITAVVAFAFVLLIVFSFNMFLINYAVYPLVDKHMIQPQLALKPQEKSPKDNDFNDVI